MRVYSMGVIKEQVGSLNARINTVNNCSTNATVFVQISITTCMVQGVVNYLIIIVFVTLQTSRFCDFAIFFCVSETLRQNSSKRIICNVRASQRRVDRAVYV